MSVRQALHVGGLAAGGRAKAMIAEQRRDEPVVGNRAGVLLVVGDLLQDHGSLGLHVLVAEQCLPCDVGEQIERRHRGLGPDHGGQLDVVVGRQAVEVGAQALGGAVQDPRGRVLLGALEHHVLEEVCDADLLGPFVPRAAGERDRDRGGEAPGHRQLDHAQAVRFEAAGGHGGLSIVVQGDEGQGLSARHGGEGDSCGHGCPRRGARETGAQESATPLRAEASSGASGFEHRSGAQRAETFKVVDVMTTSSSQRVAIRARPWRC